MSVDARIRQLSAFLVWHAAEFVLPSFIFFFHRAPGFSHKLVSPQRRINEGKTGCEYHVCQMRVEIRDGTALAQGFWLRWRYTACVRRGGSIYAGSLSHRYVSSGRVTGFRVVRALSVFVALGNKCIICPCNARNTRVQYVHKIYESISARAAEYMHRSVPGRWQGGWRHRERA